MSSTKSLGVPQKGKGGCIDCCEVMRLGEITGEAAVWNRVVGTGREGGERAGTIGSELLALLEQKRQMLLDYRQLINQSGGAIQRVLRRLAQEEYRQEQQMTALFYLISGQRPCIAAQVPAKERVSIPDGLRRMMQAEEQCAGRLEALAARSSGETAQVLTQLCLQERQHFHRLVGLLGKSLPWKP